MVNTGPCNSSKARIPIRKSSFTAVTLYAVSVSGFLIYARNIVEMERQSFLYVGSRSEKVPKLHVHDEDLWGSFFSHSLHPCVKPTAKYEGAQGFDRYLTMKSIGGLINQMRTGMSDMVAVAHIINATLVIPQLDKRSIRQDSSLFSDIFDEVHFIESLKGDVRIVKELPKKLEAVPGPRKHFISWSGVGYYEEMTRLSNDYQVIHVAKSDSRLANNDLPLDIQRLRCRALYNSLRFSPPIENLGKFFMGLPGKLGSEHCMTVKKQRLVERLRSLGGRYIALHLKYEKDTLSFTGCTYGLTDAESEELRIMRENTNHWKSKKINSTEQRTRGFCPLNLKEVGIFLQALGFPPSTIIYIAAGDIYGGNTHLLELSSRFPNLVFKETLAEPEELKAFANHASQTAALDYIISVESDVFVPSYSGKVARAVEGHRRFLGHRKTINPDRLRMASSRPFKLFSSFLFLVQRKGLVHIFDKLETGDLEEGSSLSYLVQRMHKNSKGLQGKDNVPYQDSKFQHVSRPRSPFMKIHIPSVYVVLAEGN